MNEQLLNTVREKVRSAEGKLQELNELIDRSRLAGIDVAEHIARRNELRRRINKLRAAF